MLVLATFILVCMVAVLFLLRFFFALESEVRSARKHSQARVEHISAYQIPSGIRVVPVLAVVHSDSWWQPVSVRPIPSETFIFARGKVSA
jgi:hypothetical protein